MRSGWQIGVVLLGGLLGHVGRAQETAARGAAAGCAQTTNFDVDSHWAALPARTRAMLRQVTLPRVRATVADNGSGLTGTDVSRVPLAAVELGQPARGRVLYAVSWRERTFGVNAPIWLVEVGASRAVDRTPAPAPGSGALLHDGFGVSVLPVGADGYPGVMVGSKGFKDGGGAEREEDCLRKVGERYVEAACPVGCHEVVNHE